jgi:hypothetical protein
MPLGHPTPRTMNLSLCNRSAREYGWTAELVIGVNLPRNGMSMFSVKLTRKADFYKLGVSTATFVFSTPAFI